MILTPRLLLTPPAGCPDPAEQSSTTTTAGDQATEERRPEGVPGGTCPRRRATEPPETIALHAGDTGPSTPWRERPGTTENRGVPGSSPGLAGPATTRMRDGRGGTRGVH